MIRSSVAVAIFAAALTTPAVAGPKERFIAALTQGIEVQMLLYSRISPKVAAQLTPVSFDAADMEVFDCVFSTAGERDILHLFDVAADRNEALNTLILSDETISLATLEQRPDVVALMEAQGKIGTPAEQDMMASISKDCGTMEMMMQKMQAAGVMKAMQSLDQN